MPQFDLPLAELERHRTSLVPPADFDAFWSETLAATRAFPLDVELHPVETGLTAVDVFDVRFAGWGGQRVAGWLYVPRDRSGPGPAVVEYIGYTGGRGLPLQHLHWSALGYLHLVVDTRGQGSAHTSVGATADDSGAAGPHVPGFLTMGIESPATYYYRRVFSDAVRAVEVVRQHPLVDPDQVAVAGGSQGGGITLAVAGLVDGLAAALPDVPFLCDIRRATEITDARPYQEIVLYCRAHRDLIEQAFGTLSYFDGTVFATRASAPALFSVALMDEICPPSTCFAASNAYGGSRWVEVYPYNGHEGGGIYHLQRQVAFLAELLTP